MTPGWADRRGPFSGMGTATGENRVIQPGDTLRVTGGPTPTSYLSSHGACARLHTMRPTVPPPPLPAHPHGSVAFTIRGLAVGARPSGVWRSAAFALLRLNPKECEALALVFEDETVTADTRLVVLDLLAGAGTFEAQVIMRRLLALAVARRDNRMFATFVQRLGIVECPDGPTLRFLMSVYAESRGEPHDVRAACAYALGAASGQAFSAGDQDAAVRASDVLRRDLQPAASASEKCALLTALGNAGVPKDVNVLLSFTQDADAAVRSSAALALRKMNAPEARANLVLLLGDREAKVSQSALAALSEHQLDDAEIERLAEQVLAARTPLGLDMRILRLIIAQRPRLTSASGRSGAIEHALRLLLGRVEAAGSSSNENTSTGWGSGERRALHAQVPQPTKFPSFTSGSGSVPSMISARAQTPIPAPPQPVSAMTLAYAPLPQVSVVQQSVPAKRPRLDATVVDQAPLGSGAYRIASPLDSVDDAPRRAAAGDPLASAPTVVQTRPQPRLSPNAIVRGR